MNSMTRAFTGANANVYQQLAGSRLESVLETARAATAPTIPAARATPTVRLAGPHLPATRPTAKEIRAAGRVLGDVEAIYVKRGFATAYRDGFALTRLGEIAFACARLREGKDGRGQPRAIHGKPLGWLQDCACATFSTREGWRLTAKGRELVAAIGLGGSK